MATRGYLGVCRDRSYYRYLEKSLHKEIGSLPYYPFEVAMIKIDRAVKMAAMIDRSRKAWRKMRR